MRSMTGFAQLENKIDRFAVKVSVKSINHRYLDLNLFLNDGALPFETELRAIIQKTLERGKVDFSLKLYFEGDNPVNVKLRNSVITGIVDAFREAGEKTGLNSEVCLKDLLHIPDIIQVEPLEISFSKEEAAFVFECCRDVLEKLTSMKEEEGKFLATDFRERLKIIESNICSIENLSKGMAVIYAEKLKDRMSNLLNIAEIESAEERIVTEAALFADRSDISEEIIRVKSHLRQVNDLLDNGKSSMGKKLDFLFQEIQREINTIGSKSKYINITDQVIMLKSEMEKMREQVRNIE